MFVEQLSIHFDSSNESQYYKQQVLHRAEMMVVPEKQMKEHREDSEMNNTLLNHLIRNRIMNLMDQLTKFDRIDDEFVRVLENQPNQE